MNELWQSRIDGCPDAPILAYKYTSKLADGKYLHTFELVSGSVDAPNDKERSYFEYILCEDRIYGASLSDPSDEPGLPVEALFNDLLVFNLMFPLVAGTRARWNAQPREVQENVFVTDVEDIALSGNRTLVVCKTWGAFDLRLGRGKVYRLSRRLVDFNLNKVLTTLLELDMRTPPHPPLHLPNPPAPDFLQLIAAPQTFASLKANFDDEADATLMLHEEETVYRLYKNLASSLDMKAAEKLILKNSQRKALGRVISHRLTVIWGPPGRTFHRSTVRSMMADATILF